MRDKIEEKEANEIIKYAVENPDITVEEISEKYKISTHLAFYIIKKTNKKIIFYKDKMFVDGMSFKEFKKKL